MNKTIYEGEAWLGAPPEIGESQIEKTLEADVVVVGAGLAGVAAARTAACRALWPRPDRGATCGRPRRKAWC